jgi:nucleoid DNA-binding protein
MDAEQLSKMVREIILETESVTLPGLGSFVAEVVPASFSDKGYTINPPYRRLSFSHREGGDTRLADLYAASNGVSREEALQLLSEFLSGLRETLMSRKAVALPGLGRLRATRENNFFFVPDENPDIDPTGFGLYPISLKTHQETAEEVSSAVSELAAAFAPVPPAEEKPAEKKPVEEELLEEKPAEEIPVVSVEEEPAVPAEPEALAVPAPSFWRRVAVIACILLAAFALFLILLAILGRVAPDLADRLLYTREELELLKL